MTSAIPLPYGPYRAGYWILLANGAVYAYGAAKYFGNPAGQYGSLNPATTIIATGDGGGYWVADAQGAVDNFGDAPNDGSLAGTKLNGPIIGGDGF